jgi:hypothetical protein
MSVASPPPAGAWAQGLSDPVAVARTARQEVIDRIPWWWRALRRATFLQAVEVYVRAVLIAYHRGEIEGWPPGLDGAPTMDMALQPRRRRRTRARSVERAS